MDLTRERWPRITVCSTTRNAANIPPPQQPDQYGYGYRELMKRNGVLPEEQGECGSRSLCLIRAQEQE
ncbi:hypothetical protein KQX54_000727 [Cotesia glomerata]|uniref:Uncharacterized protein n=1 Tax=Cotesia glomerata TaxID=32391 RepID=A0AAV7ISS5_COTGL|nr:hypothetical protein KQX54_000727 [Cotesia glomerata]